MFPFSDHRRQQPRTVECHGLQCRPHQMGSGSAPGYPGDRTSRLGLPVRRSHAHKSRHEINATGVGHAARMLLAFGRVAKDTEAIPEPLDGGAGNEHTPFQRVPRLSAGPQATVARSPRGGTGGRGPARTSRKAPVP